jgi:hypothetical protein
VRELEPGGTRDIKRGARAFERNRAYPVDAHTYRTRRYPRRRTYDNDTSPTNRTGRSVAFRRCFCGPSTCNNADWKCYLCSTQWHSFTQSACTDGNAWRVSTALPL